MSPQDAVQKLIASGWSESRIAKAVGTSQPTIHRIKKGAQSRGSSFDTCAALILLSAAVANDPSYDADANAGPGAAARVSQAPDPTPRDRRQAAGEGGPAADSTVTATPAPCRRLPAPPRPNQPAPDAAADTPLSEAA